MIRRRQEQVYKLCVVPGVLVALLLVGTPLAYVLYLSLRNLNFLKDTNDFVGFSNYAKVFQDISFLMALFRNILYVVVVVAANFIIGFGMALVCSVEFRGSRSLRYIIVLPMLLLPTAASVLWRFLYHPDFSTTNQIITLLGFRPTMWLAQPSTVLWAVMLTDIWAWTPWMFLILLAGLEGLPKDPLEAARMDGASGWQVVRHVTLPMMTPVIRVAVSLKAIDTFRTFDYVWVMTKGGPGQSSQILSTYIYRQAFKNLSYGYGSSLSIVVMLVTIGLSAGLLYDVLRQG